ncbi:hypothetical protein [Risungbinella massiliensis]|uniref:hypothetical protein n=1 Tax=Risungbinella massiliensis TaxID=1329796 RepID=UPI00069C5F33|nr:hypothetical protein [Risungbinella massiliensis]
MNAVLSTNIQESAEVELGKFFMLFGKGVKGLTMFSGLVDNIWHELLETPIKYHDFCEKTAGKQVAHVEMNGVGPIKWVTQYETEFGKLNEVWFMNKHGQLDTQAYKEYQVTGEVKRQSWDCGPVPTE